MESSVAQAPAGRTMLVIAPTWRPTRWRMLLAGRSLSRGKPFGAVARSPGYESERAFSTAYKRVMGSTPRDHARLTAAAIRG